MLRAGYPLSQVTASDEGGRQEGRKETKRTGRKVREGKNRRKKPHNHPTIY